MFEVVFYVNTRSAKKNNKKKWKKIENISHQKRFVQKKYFALRYFRNQPRTRIKLEIESLKSDLIKWNNISFIFIMTFITKK